jgi:hypothetical protein
MTAAAYALQEGHTIASAKPISVEHPMTMIDDVVSSMRGGLEALGRHEHAPEGQPTR